MGIILGLKYPIERIPAKDGNVECWKMNQGPHNYDHILSKFRECFFFQKTKSYFQEIQLIYTTFFLQNCLKQENPFQLSMNY